MTAPESSDEGEIIENGTEDLKATSLPQPDGGSSVDPRNRTRSGYSRSPERDSASSSKRSRSPRGRGRSFQTATHRDFYESRRHNPPRDPRNFTVRYDDALHYDDFRRDGQR